MKVDLVFVLGTAAFWLGVLWTIAGAYQLARLLAVDGPDRRSLASRGVGSLAAGAVLVLLSTTLTPSGSGVFRLPLMWPVAPFAAWMTMGCASLALYSVAGAVTAINDRERAVLLRRSGLSALAGGAFLFVHLRLGDTVEMLKGAIELSWTQVGLLAVLALCASAIMGATARAARARSYAKVVITHLTLLAGSFVFGLPFAWLLITSFKEDIDLVSKNGLVWVPRVQVTTPYRDPNAPIVTGTYQGRAIEGQVLDTDSQGVSTVQVRRPLALSSTVFTAPRSSLTEIDQQVPIVTAVVNGQMASGRVVTETPEGQKIVEVQSPPALAGKKVTLEPSAVTPVRTVGLRWQNYIDALDFLPPETQYGLVYLRNTIFLVILNIVGTVLSSSVVAYAFARLRFPGKDSLFVLLLATMMLPAAVTMMPTFLIFRTLGWIDTLYPLWVPAFFASAFNVFLLRQFFLTLPVELEDAAKIDGCSYATTYWSVMLPQIKPALAVIAVWTFIGTWNNFMGPLIYVNSPEHMPIAYAVQLFQTDRGTEPGLMMALATMSMIPVLALFAFAQRYFIEGVTLSGLGGR